MGTLCVDSNISGQISDFFFAEDPNEAQYLIMDREVDTTDELMEQINEKFLGSLATPTKVASISDTKSQALLFNND